MGLRSSVLTCLPKVVPKVPYFGFGLFVYSYLHLPPFPPSSSPFIHPRSLTHLVRNPNNATSGPPPSIAGLQTLLMPALPQIIGPRVDNNGASQHGVFADQLDVFVGDGSLAVARAVGLEVAQVADVAG